MSDNKKPVPGAMTDVDVSFVSLVRKGANRQQVKIYKEDDDEQEVSKGNTEDEEQRGFFDVIRKFFKADATATPAKPKKPTSFAGAIAVADIMDGMWRVNDVLREILRNILADESITDKNAAMSQAIDEFATYMKNKINTAKISKEDLDDPPEVIEKAGRKFSGKNEGKLRAALAAIQDILADTDPDTGEKGTGDTVKKENNESETLAEVVKAAVGEAVKPLETRISELEKADGGEEAPPADGGGENSPAEDVAAIIKSAVEAALEPMSKRLERVEKSRGLSRTDENDETDPNKIEKEDATFDGLFV